jgi:putative SOS response-associated peptidase YedK
MKDGRPFGMGGLWERWEDGEPIETCAVITTSANGLVGPINNRMPVIIPEEDYDRWLDPQFYDEEELRRMMCPFPAERMVVVRA